MIRAIFTVFLISTISLTDSFSQKNIVTTNINSIFDEQSPIISPDGKYLFYTIAHNEHNIGGTKDTGDIWYAVWQDSVWSMPFHGGSVINNKHWNGVIGFAQDGSMYLHHHYQDGKQGISVAKKKGDYWEKPINVGIPYFMNKSSQQSGSVSSNGQVILLSLESYGTMGAEDIYILHKDGNKFTEPRNIGSVINTRYQEMTPILAEDDRTLYFASNGLNGKGSMDIYKTIRLDNTWLNWSKPVNVEEVNTEGREVSFNYNPSINTAWFVSTKDSDGYGDIRFRIIESFKDTTTVKPIPILEEDTLIAEITEPLVIDSITTKEMTLSGLVSNAMDSTEVVARLSLSNLEKDTTITVMSNENTGMYSLSIPYDGTYSLKILADNYLPHIEELTFDSTSINNKDYWLIPVKVGEVVQLEHVLFERGKAVMLPTSYSDLDAVVEMMLDNINIEIVLAGHTDNQGSSKLNYQLSEDRVESVIQYIIDKGISKKRISGKGYGGSRPIASNINPETRKLNRRVEFTIIKN